MDWTSWSQTWSTTTRRTTPTSRKHQKCSSKILRWKRMYLLLRATQRLKQKPQRRISASLSTKTVSIGERKELGPILNHKIIRPQIIQCRRNWSIFFVMAVYLETMMERLNSGKSKIIFRSFTYSWKNMDGYWTTSSCVPNGKKTKHSSSAWTITSRRRWCDRILEIKRWSSERIRALSLLASWNVEEQNGRRRRQQEQIFNRTQSHWFYTSGQCVNSEQFSSSAFIMLDVHSVYTTSQTQDW